MIKGGFKLGGTMHYSIKLTLLVIACVVQTACYQVTTITLDTKSKITDGDANAEVQRIADLVQLHAHFSISQKGNTITLGFDEILPQHIRDTLSVVFKRLSSTKFDNSEPQKNITFDLIVTDKNLPEEYQRDFADKRNFKLIPGDLNLGQMVIRNYHDGLNRKALCLYEIPLRQKVPSLYYYTLLRVSGGGKEVTEGLKNVIKKFNKATPIESVEHKITPENVAYTKLTTQILLLKGNVLSFKFDEVDYPANDLSQYNLGVPDTTNSDAAQLADKRINMCHEKILDSSDIFYQKFLFSNLAGNIISYKFGEETIP